MSGQLGTPATTQRVTTSALLLEVLHFLETKLPGEAKALLISVAQQLRTTAAAAEGPGAASLSAWAERFQRAADSGKLISWLPSAPGSSHFGVRAYQAAAPAEVDLAVLDAALSQTLAAAVAQDSAAIANPRLMPEADGGGLPAPNDAALETVLARHPELASTSEPRVRRRANRAKRPRARRRRAHRRWQRAPH
jgi:hypothetical protein